MSVATIRTKIRNLLEDSSKTVKDIFTYESSSIFSLSESNVIAITTVFKNSVELADSLYSYDTDTNKVTISTSLTGGDTIEIDYTSYLNYSQTELTEYIQSALVHLSINNYYDFEYDVDDDAIYPDPEPREENLIAIVSSILISPDNKSIRLPDITINVPNDLPLNDKIGKTIAHFKKDTAGIFFV